MADKSKRLPPEMERHVALLVQDWVRERQKSRQAPEGQRALAKAIGLSQPVLSRCLKYDVAKPEAIGIGINGLLALRKVTQQSIEAILGLELPSAVTDARADLEKCMEAAEVLAQQIDALVVKPTPGSKLGKALDQVQRLKGRLEHLRREEERVRRVNATPGGKRRAG